MNDNTILRIKVPAHLYESVKEQLTINEAKKSGKAFGDWKVVKEKKAPKKEMEKVEEINNIEETDNKMEMKAKTLDELKVAKDQIEKKIAEMEEAKKEGGMIKEAVDPNLIAGIIGLLFGSLPILYTLIKQYVGAKTPEDKKKVIAQAADTISKKMSGGMEEAKKKVEKAIYDDEDDSEDPLYLELVDELGEKILHKLFDQGWDIDDIAADPQGAAASLKRK
jgi:hypothetical protein